MNKEIETMHYNINTIVDQGKHKGNKGHKNGGGGGKHGGRKQFKGGPPLHKKHKKV